MQYIWEAIGYDVDNPPTFFTNEHKAMEFANSFYEQNHLSWYQITEAWYRGNNARTGADWAVLRRKLN